MQYIKFKSGLFFLVILNNKCKESNVEIILLAKFSKEISGKYSKRIIKKKLRKMKTFVFPLLFIQKEKFYSKADSFVDIFVHTSGFEVDCCFSGNVF